MFDSCKEKPLAMQEKKFRKGPWSEEEDEQLIGIVSHSGEKRWDSIARASGLGRSGKSCRLRWLNYLRPNLKHGPISPEEEQIIFQLHQRWGNKWSRIARRLPGRTDNVIKNYWRTYLRRKAVDLDQGQGVNHDPTISNNTRKRKIPFKEDDVQSCKEAKHGDSFSALRETGPAADECLSSTSDALPSFIVASSPYETRMLNWLFDDQTGIASHPEQCDLSFNDSCFSYPSWHMAEVSDTNSLWDYHPGSLWDLDL